MALKSIIVKLMALKSNGFEGICWCLMLTVMKKLRLPENDKIYDSNLNNNNNIINTNNNIPIFQDSYFNREGDKLVEMSTKFLL